MPWLTPFLFKQAADESAAGLETFADGVDAPSFTHVLHVYADPAAPANGMVQDLTFETIRMARRFAAHRVETACAAVTFPEDAGLVPDDVIRAPALRRVVTDLARFAAPRPLPLLFDLILEGAAAVPCEPTRVASDFIVLTNADIHLQPYFYLALADLVRRGYDVITVNRRTIDAAPGAAHGLPLLFADHGVDHPGFDCFVFPRRFVDQFERSNACVGAGHVMRSLLFNLVAMARRFVMLTTAHLTFHLGDDRRWNDARFRDYVEFNIGEAVDVARRLCADPAKAERLRQFMTRHPEPPRFLQAFESGVAPYPGTPT